MIQVFSIEDRDKLIANGYKYLGKNNIGDTTTYVFQENGNLKFSLNNVKFAKLNRLNF